MKQFWIIVSCLLFVTGCLKSSPQGEKKPDVPEPTTLADGGTGPAVVNHGYTILAWQEDNNAWKFYPQPGLEFTFNKEFFREFDLFPASYSHIKNRILYNTEPTAIYFRGVEEPLSQEMILHLQALNTDVSQSVFYQDENFDSNLAIALQTYQFVHTVFVWPINQPNLEDPYHYYYESQIDYSFPANIKETAIKNSESLSEIKDTLISLSNQNNNTISFYVRGLNEPLTLEAATSIHDNLSEINKYLRVETLKDVPFGADKPVIYLYPEKAMDVQVSLDYHGELLVTYPAYDKGWFVHAYPDGRLLNYSDGMEYSYLFWEGVGPAKYDMSKGFVVKGSDSAKFLQDKLAYLGLTPREYNEFIVYWYPKLLENNYNLITFQGKTYTDLAPLEISPKPDSMLRVFMVYQPLDHPVKIEEQALLPFERTGFSVIEWGGTQVR